MYLHVTSLFTMFLTTSPSIDTRTLYSLLWNATQHCFWPRNSFYKKKKKKVGQCAHDHESYHELHHSETKSRTDRMAEWPIKDSVMMLGKWQYFPGWGNVPQEEVYVLNYKFTFDVIIPWLEYLGVRTKKQADLFSPSTLKTHSQKFYSHCYEFGLWWFRGLISQGRNIATREHNGSFNWKLRLPTGWFVLLQHELAWLVVKVNGRPKQPDTFKSTTGLDPLRMKVRVI